MRTQKPGLHLELAVKRKTQTSIPLLLARTLAVTSAIDDSPQISLGAEVDGGGQISLDLDTPLCLAFRVGRVSWHMQRPDLTGDALEGSFLVAPQLVRARLVILAPDAQSEEVQQSAGLAVHVHVLEAPLREKLHSSPCGVSLKVDLENPDGGKRWLPMRIAENHVRDELLDGLKRAGAVR